MLNEASSIGRISPSKLTGAADFSDVESPTTLSRKDFLANGLVAINAFAFGALALLASREANASQLPGSATTSAETPIVLKAAVVSPRTTAASPYQNLLKYLAKVNEDPVRGAIFNDILEFYPDKNSTYYRTNEPFGVSNKDLEGLANIVSSAVISGSKIGERMDVKTAGDTVLATVSSICNGFGIDSKSALFERLLAHGICDWTRTHILYDQTYSKWTEEQKARGDQSGWVLAGTPPRAVCGGFGATVRDISRYLNLNCNMMTGHTKGKDNIASGNANHTWAMFKFSNGVVLPADTSSCSISLKDAMNLNGQIRSFWSLPVYRYEMAVFMGFRHHQNENGISFGDKQNQLISSVSCDEWKRWDVRFLGDVEPKPMLNSGFYWGMANR